MRNLLRKLHLVPNQSDLAEGSSSSSKGSRVGLGDCPAATAAAKASPSRPLLEQKPLSGLAGWLSAVTSKHGHGPQSPPNVEGCDGGEVERRDSGSSNSRDPELEEEYQIQLALELSAREDPEAVQIEAVKQISLGSCPPQNSPAEVVAYRYWNYNALNYDDKILDGFYDLYGVLAESGADKMPSLVDLQRIPVSNSINWEAILVDRSSDTELLRLEQTALQIAATSRSSSLGIVNHHLVRKLAILVANNMGKHVEDPGRMLKAWRIHSNHLREQAGNMVLPLGKLRIGLARHRALLFKVLADSVGVPCQLLKGQHFTGSDDVAMNIVKLDDGREYIVDLMADPGTLIPSDAAGSQIEFEEPLFGDNYHVGASSSSASGSMSSLSPCKESLSDELKSQLAEKSIDFHKGSRGPATESSGRPTHPISHARSPSWTEGVSSPAAHRMKVKDVSQYMIDAAKENPRLAQKLHDVLLESGVVAPPNLFTEVYNDPVEDDTSQVRDIPKFKSRKNGSLPKPQVEGLPGPMLPPLPNQAKFHSSRQQQEIQKAMDGLDVPHTVDSNAHHEITPAIKFAKNMPVAAAAAATAAVVASSMVVAVAKSNADSNMEVPMAAAAAVVATTAAVTKQYGQLESSFLNQTDLDKKSGDGSGGSGNSKHDNGSGNAQQSKVERDFDGTALHVDGERNSDKSTEDDSVKSDNALDDVAEWEILWEEITVGERIGLGSYGEVYRGEWHGTEVAVKRFLDQDISGDALVEFGKEVRIMKRLRHPNVVLFMGAVTRPPYLSIVTEFLPRGSLYRLLHRPNNQLDERRRLRMALDVARGMNYLHNCTPILVHRDLKSPNLLVDKNWVVKVCDFGLSKIKHTTFLSSRSNAGTAEWMAPEVLRNEPSDEKCDVYSFGVILWELTTLQQPWGGMNPMQVVGAVGFQHRRLDIPEDMDSVVADIIKKCWQTDPKLRPSFSEIMAALKPLQRPITSTQPHVHAAARPKITSVNVINQDNSRIASVDGASKSQLFGADCGPPGDG